MTPTGALRPGRAGRSLLTTAIDRLQALDLGVSAHETTAQQFASGLTSDQQWDVAQSTFALYTLPVDERD